MSIALQIERLVIDEALLGGERATAIRDAIETELVQSLAHRDAIDALRGIGNPYELQCHMSTRGSPGSVGVGELVANAVRERLKISSRSHAEKTRLVSGGSR